jgi:YD repeat-containing protein
VYDNNGNLIKILENSNVSCEYEYDNKENLIMGAYYMGGWGMDKIEYTYDLSFPIHRLITPNTLFYDTYDYSYNYIYNYDYMLTEKKYYWRNTNNDWEYVYTEKYYYSFQRTVEPFSENIIFFPNSAHDKIYFHSFSTIEQINFYDVSGKTLKQIHNPKEQFVDISDLIQKKLYCKNKNHRTANNMKNS